MQFILGNSSITIEDRVRGALWGSLTGDAFCLGSHWIYSHDEIAEKFPGGIQGFETPFPGHYHFGKKSGDFTHYGDAALLMLSSVAQCGKFEAADFGSRLVRLMLEDNYTGYRDHAMKGMLSNYTTFREHNPAMVFDYQQGADDDQPATVSHLAPVVTAHLDDASLLPIVANATRVCQNNSRAIAYSQATALIMRHLVNGNSVESAVAETRKAMSSPDPSNLEVCKKMKTACAAREMSIFDATMKFGQSCPLASSFTAALHATLVCYDDFAGAIKATATAGGDSAGRAAMIGAWLGAHLGVAAIPPEWRIRLTAHDQIHADIEMIVTKVIRPQ